MAQLRKGILSRRIASALVKAITVSAGSLQDPNGSKPYYYNGFYYVFFSSGGNIYYCYSADGKTWSSPILIASVAYAWAVMGIDNLVLLSRIVNNYVTVAMGMIQANGTISFSADVQLGYSDSRVRTCWCYATKIAGVRKLFVNAIACDDNYPPPHSATDSLWVSDNDGASWTFLEGCKRQWTGLFYGQLQPIPFNDGNKVQEIWSYIGNTYHVSGLYRDGSTCQTNIQFDTYRNQYYLGDQGDGILINSNVNFVYIDNSNNLKHAQVAENGTWQTVAIIKSNVNATAGLTLCYDSATGLLYIIYYEATAIKLVTWNSTAYSSEGTIITGESAINQLTAYPAPLNRKILLNWTDASGNVRFASIGV